LLTKARAYGIYDKEYQVYEKKVRIAKTRTRMSLLMTKAAINTIITQPRKRMVATTRTGLNIVLICLANPTRKPVPVSEIKMPRIYSSAKLTILPNTNRMEPTSETTKPPTRHPRKPYSLCFLLSPKNSKADG